MGDATGDLLREALPPAMLEAKRWLVWKLIPNKDPEKNPRKVPYYVDGEPRQGTLDTPPDLARLESFDAALAALQAGNYTGLGFALGPDGTGRYWQGIDLDNIADHPGLELVRDDLPGYTEVSPRGAGCHAIGYGLWFPSLAKNSTGIEAYASGRFFTVTGAEAGLGEPVCLESFVRERLASLHGRPKPKPTMSDPPGAGAGPVVPKPEQVKDLKKDLKSALFFMNADDYATWIDCGLALHCLGDLGKALWFAWSQLSDKFDPEEAARKWKSFGSARSDYRSVFTLATNSGWVNPAKGRKKRKTTPAPGKLEELVSVNPALGMATFRDSYTAESGHYDVRFEPAKNGKRQAHPDADASHHVLAKCFLQAIPAPGYVYVEGALWQYTGEIWERVPDARLEVDIGERFDSHDKCQRKSDYGAIRRHIEDICRDDAFFEQAPLGLMAGGEFWKPEGESIKRLPPSPDLRQRYRVPFAPDFDSPYPRFRSYLDRTFKHDDAALSNAQTDLLQEALGIILLGGFYRYEKALFLYGRARSGKSVLLRLLEGLLPSELIGSVSPFDWAHDYHRAALAGIRVNVVGELPNDKPIPASDFKSVIGRDRIAARNPFGRVFSFRPTAAHLFNSNSFISTKDQHPAFFDRWLILHFQNTVPADERDPELVTRILADEGPALLAWALLGAVRLLRHGGRFTRSPAAELVLDKWRCSSDSVRAFMEECTKPQKGVLILRGEAHTTYRGWCEAEQRRAVGRNAFYNRLEDIGIFIGKHQGDHFIYDRAWVNK